MADHTGLAAGLAATRLVQDHYPDGVNPDDHPTCDCGWTAEDPNERWADHLVHVLAVADLLADPEQHAELVEIARTCTGHPDRRDPQVPSHPELIQAARDERDLVLWLHAEAKHRAEELTAFAGEQANARRESDRVRNLAAREAADLRDERDTARAQLAEKTEYAGEKAREGDVLSLQVEDLTAERDALQARIDAALARLKEADELSADWPPSLEDWSAYNSKLIHARAALQGDQPTEPDRVPCGNPNTDCGRRGGRARCGGCTEDEQPQPAGEAQP